MSHKMNISVYDFFINKINIVSDIVFHKRVLTFVKKTAVFLALLFFCLSLLIVFLHQEKLLNFTWPDKMPRNYFSSIYVAFTFILFYEVLSMIYAIPKSISDSIGKQFEIMSLIIIRSLFEHTGEYFTIITEFEKEYTGFSSLINLLNKNEFESILAGSIGSILIFYLVRVYYKLLKHSKVIVEPTDLQSFVAIKKLLGLVLIIVLFYLGFAEIYYFFNYIIIGDVESIYISHGFFKDLFSVMIFVDILLVLLAVRYSSSYEVVFRNSGLALSTVILRKSFSTNLTISVLMAILAVGIGIAVSYIYNLFEKQNEKLSNISTQ